MEESKIKRRRDLPPLPQLQRSGPSMQSQDTVDEVPAKAKRKKPKKQANGVSNTDGVEMGAVGNHPALDSRDASTPELTNDGPPQRRKRKKKTPTIDLEDDQADLVNGDGPEQTTDGEEVVKKSRKKRKPKVQEPSPQYGLEVEEDDIITDAPPPCIPQHALFSAPHGQSQPVEKVFVERNKRFLPAERSDRRKTSDQTDILMDLQPLQPLFTTRDVSLRVHGGFRVLGLLAHGFLAGYAVWNTVVVYVLAGRQLTSLGNLLQQYHSLAYVSQSLLYLLLAISTVAAFDRMNLAKGSVALREFATLDPIALASFLYFSALVLSLSQQMTSDRINLYHTANGSLWPPEMQHPILYPWLTVNLVVAVLVGLAWVFISTRPEVDHTERYLMAMELDNPKPEEKNDFSA